MGRLGVECVVQKGIGVDVFLLQEIPLGKYGEVLGVEGYRMIAGIGGVGGEREGEIGRKAAVGILIHERWEGWYRILERGRCKIGMRLEIGKGKKLDIWCVYVGTGKHRDFIWPGGDGNVVVMGDVNARNELWGGDGEEGNVEGVMVRDWLENEGLVLGTKRGRITRISGRKDGRDGTLDVGVWKGDMEVREEEWEGIGGLDHIPLEMVLKVEGSELGEERLKKGRIDWDGFRMNLNWEGKWERWERMLERGGRKELDEVVGEAEDWWERLLEENKGKGKWKGKGKRWWNEEVEESYGEMRLVEKLWEKGNRSRGVAEDMKERRKEFGMVVKRVKGEFWGKYLETLGMNEGFKWIKTDRDFVVDVPPIENEEGIRVEGDVEKGVAIVRGLGKREELEQEEEGYEGKVKLEEWEVEEALMEQKDGKAAGENGLGGKVLKEIWREGSGRGVLVGVYRRSLELGYVPRRFRNSVGIIMRKPNKLDYGLPSSYRVINLLDVWSKGLERVVCKRLEKWGEKGMGKEQFGARKGRSSLEAVGSLREKWEKGGGRGLLICMDVQGGYENVGVRKMDIRLKEVGVDEGLRKWISSFLREREVVVRIGSRLGGRTKIKGGTVQGSPLSPILFMFLLGGVLEEVRKERVEGMRMVAVVDDVDFMFVGKSREGMLEMVKRVEVGLWRGLGKWEVDVQKMKTEGLWMRNFVKEGEGVGELEWLGEKVRMMQSVRVLGVWFQSDGGWREHVKNRIGIAEKRWKLMLRLLGKGGRGMAVRSLGLIFKAVVEKCLLYGMEVYWNGSVRMRRRLQVWLNKGLRRILGAVMSTPVDAMLGEMGWKRVEWILDKRVERWGMRLMRGEKSEGYMYGEDLRRRLEAEGEKGGMGLMGRLRDKVERRKLKGEVWEREVERLGKLGWENRWEGSKLDRAKLWEKGREERERDWVVGVSDASRGVEGMGIGGGVWEGKRELEIWSKNGGFGLTVEGGEMWGVSEVLKYVEEEYRGERRKLVVGTDNLGVCYGY